MKRVNPADITAGLEAVLESETFARSERSRELLRYLVSRDLAGESDRLKGFAIALDVFGRDKDFDSSTASVVRVQAGRLRDLLDNFYEGEGSDEQVRITVPRGTYVPIYKYTGAPRRQKPAEPPEAEAQVPVSVAVLPSVTDGQAGAPAGQHPHPGADYAAHVVRNIRYFWVALAVIVVLLGFVLVQMSIFHLDGDAGRVGGGETHTHDETPGAYAGVPESRFLPWIMISETDGDFDTDMVVDAIGRFETVTYIHREEVASHAETPGFLLNIVSRGTVTLFRFFDAETGVLVATGQVDAGSGPDMAVQVGGMLTELVRPGGALYGYLISEAHLNPLTICLVATNAYFADPSEPRYVRALSCLERLAAKAGWNRRSCMRPWPSCWSTGSGKAIPIRRRPMRMMRWRRRGARIAARSELAARPSVDGDGVRGHRRACCRTAPVQGSACAQSL